MNKFKPGDQVIFTATGISMYLVLGREYIVDIVSPANDGHICLKNVPPYMWFEQDLFTLKEIYNTPLDKALNE